MKLRIKFAILTAFILLSLSSYASTVGLVCDNCSDGTYKTAAENSVGLGYHTVYVFDTVRWKATEWSVTVEQEGPITLRFATEMVLNASVASGFGKYQEITEDFLVPATWRPIVVPSNLFNSVYGVAGNPDAMNDLLAWYRNYQNTATWTINWAFSAAIALTNKISGLAPAVKFNFDDGSTLTVTLDDWDPTTFSFIFVFKSALDSNGNVVPANANEYDPNNPVHGGVGPYYGNGGIPFSIYDANGNILAGFIPGNCYNTDCGFEGPIYSCTLVEVAGSCYYSP